MSLLCSHILQDIGNKVKRGKGFSYKRRDMPFMRRTKRTEMYFSCFLQKRACYFLVSEQESNQRSRHRRGAEFCAPAQKAALSYVPLPARTWHPSEHLNGQKSFSDCGLADSGGSALAALPIYYDFTLRAKNRNIFCPNRIEVKVLQSLSSAGREILKRASLARGCARRRVSERNRASPALSVEMSATTQRLLSRLLLVLFLAKQEKYIDTRTILQKGMGFCEKYL